LYIKKEAKKKLTTIFENKVMCCVCGEKSYQTDIGSSYSSGSPDVDTRPPEMERSLIEYWVFLLQLLICLIFRKIKYGNY